jgi:hypothetical protein
MSQSFECNVDKSNGSMARVFNLWWRILLSSILHGAPCSVIPQQKPRPPLGLTSIPQTRTGFQRSIVVIDVVKGRKLLGLLVVVGNLCGVPSPALYAIAVGSLHTLLRGCWLLAWDAFFEKVDVLKKAFRCSMHRIRPISGMREAISFQINAATSCPCGCRLR